MSRCSNTGVRTPEWWKHLRYNKNVVDRRIRAAEDGVVREQLEDVYELWEFYGDICREDDPCPVCYFPKVGDSWT